MSEGWSQEGGYQNGKDMNSSEGTKEVRYDSSVGVFRSFLHAGRRNAEARLCWNCDGHWGSQCEEAGDSRILVLQVNTIYAYVKHSTHQTSKKTSGVLIVYRFNGLLGYGRSFGACKPISLGIGQSSLQLQTPTSIVDT
jgi:hypothetical protein